MHSKSAVCVRPASMDKTSNGGLATVVEPAVAVKGAPGSALFQSSINHALTVASNPHCRDSHSTVVETSQSLRRPL
jgi:hypothetical protein